MTTPTAPQPSPDPDDSGDLTPPAHDNPSASESSSDARASVPGPAPAQPPASAEGEAAGGGDDSPGFFAANRLAILGGGGAVVAIVVVVVLLFTMGVFGGGGGIASGGSSEALAYVLDDSDAMTVEVVNVASILAAAEIPSGLEANHFDTPDTETFDDPEDWKDEWRDRDWADSLPVPSWLFSEVSLDDISTAVVQDVDGSTGYVLAGDFPFDAIRELMEDGDWEEDTYRDFEVWDGRNVALLEDSGIILLGSGFVASVLKALDTDRGLIEGDSAMKRVLDKAGQGLAVLAVTENCGSFGSPALRSCDAFAMSITGGTDETANLRAAFLFSSENRAESSLDNIEEALLDTDEVDADIDSIGTDGEFVIYELTIHED